MQIHNLYFIIVRSEIASCSEKAYSYLPLADAATLLFFNNNTNELLNFASEVSNIIIIV